MPDTTPLTKIPVPLLSDVPNIETATHPGFEHLDKYVTGRYSTVSERNAAFLGTTPEIGQMVFIQSRGFRGYEVWDGSEWVEFGVFTQLRPYIDIRSNSLTTNSFSFQAICQLTVPSGNYLLESNIFYDWEEDEDPGSQYLEFNAFYPGTGVNHISFLTMDRDSPTMSNQFFETDNRASGSYTMTAGLKTDINALGAVFWGYLWDIPSGTVRISVGKRPSGGQGRVRYARGSWLRLTRV